MTKNHFNTLQKLHANKQALVLINVWDSASAAIVELNGASAIATSSASLAWANGYPDGGQMPKTTMINAIKNILRVINVPLSVDIEGGYSESPDVVAEFVLELSQLGVAGINIEDGKKSAENLIKKIESIHNKLGTESIFINARTDVYLQSLVAENLQLEETISRAKQYVDCGADGIFIPGLLNTDTISQITNEITAPLNVMACPHQYNLESLISAGAKRISLGPNSFINAYNSLINIEQFSCNSADSVKLNYDLLNRLF